MKCFYVIAKRQASVVFPTKINSRVYITPVVQLNAVGVKFAEQVKYLGLLFHALSKDNNDRSLV